MNLFRSSTDRKAKAAGIDPARIPPGQYYTDKWPVLHAGGVPRVNLETWTFRIFGLVENELTLSWDELLALAEQAPADPDPLAEWEVARVEAGLPRFGVDFDDTMMPAEAGVVDRAISFTKGCYPGQEPLSRLQHRGHVNRTLRVIEVDDAHQADEVREADRVVGRVTSAVPGLALAYVRVEVPEGAEVTVSGRPARIH